MKDEGSRGVMEVYSEPSGAVTYVVGFDNFQGNAVLSVYSAAREEDLFRKEFNAKLLLKRSSQEWAGVFGEVVCRVAETLERNVELIDECKAALGGRPVLEPVDTREGVLFGSGSLRGPVGLRRRMF